ncbi:hypothetical protein FHC51_10875 [Leclercia sp. EC_58]|uniref:hypothetical protein n=1 Tax=Leclercia sp. EC_58 TaxID=2584090 RepID=UPI001C703AA4|nr:hypothetical protein [Leclercia sp. EC_58]MBW9400312.1 hypothetical protein [Leclercia sp. EC_58]
MRIERTKSGDYLDINSDNTKTLLIDNSKCIEPIEIDWVQARKLIEVLKQWRDTGKVED